MEESKLADEQLADVAVEEIEVEEEKAPESAADVATLAAEADADEREASRLDLEEVAKQADRFENRLQPDGDMNDGYIKAIVDGTTIGFKYFDIKQAKGLRIKTRAYFEGTFEVKTDLAKEPVGEIKAIGSNIWTAHECTFSAPLTDSKAALYLVYKGTGVCSLKSIEFLH